MVDSFFFFFSKRNAKNCISLGEVAFGVLLFSVPRQLFLIITAGVAAAAVTAAKIEVRDRRIAPNRYEP